MIAEAGVGAGTRSVGAVRRLTWWHPQWWVTAAVGLAWLLLALPALDEPAHLLGLGTGSHAPAELLGHAAVMSVAMMVPLILPSLRHVAFSSMWARRHVAQLAFLGGFVLVWSAAGAVLLAVADGAVVRLGRAQAVGLGFAVAVAWQLAPGRARRLRRCALTVPLAPRGWHADRDCFVFGVKIALACTATCWGIMLAAATAHGPLVIGALLATGLWERGARRPRTRPTVLVIGAVGALAAAGGLMVLGAAPSAG